MPADHSVTAASFRSSVGLAAATFVRAVRGGLTSDAQVECAVRMTLQFVSGGAGGSGALYVQRRSIVNYIIESGLVEPATELSGRSAGQWQAWQRVVFNVLCDMLSVAIGTGGLPSDESSAPSLDGASDYTADDNLPADLVSDCGIICLLQAIGCVPVASLWCTQTQSSHHRLCVSVCLCLCVLPQEPGGQGCRLRRDQH